MSYETILLEVEANGVALLTFNRPEKRNALDQAMVDDIRAALHALQERGDVTALILTGAGGKAFISGADIGQLRDRTSADALRRINSALFREIEAFTAPTIAAIQGWALGGGCELAIACDLRVAGEGAKLGQPEVGLGIIPGAGATYRLPRLVGLGRAKELIYTGRIIGAGEALHYGLVNHVVPDADVLDRARGLADEIAHNSALAVRLAKQSLNQSGVASLDALQALESSAQAVLFDDAEKHARMTAFLEKKKRRKQAKVRDADPTISISGEVNEPLELTYEQLLALPFEAQVPEVSALMPKRKGRAVRLSALLERAGAKPSGTHVRVLSDDQKFFASQPRDVMERGLILYSLNGQRLPADQGGPYRLLIEDTPDPCANIKQVGSIEVRADDGGSACAHTAEQHETMRAKKDC